MWPFGKKEQPSFFSPPAPSGGGAAQLAPEILRLGNDYGKRFFRTILGRDAAPGDEEKQFLLAMETFYFVVYLAGRMTARLYGASQGRQFLLDLRNDAYRLLFSVQPGAGKVGFDDYRNALEEGWERSSDVYDKCPRPLPKQESDLMEGTLFWEFSKRLLTAAQAPNTDSISAALQIAIELGDAVPKTMGV